MESLMKDVVYAVRLLRRNWGFTAAVVVSLGLGIGANTAIFTLMDAVMWRMLPVREPDRLLVVGRQQGATIQTGFNYAGFRLLRDNNPVAEVAGYTTAPVNVTIDGPPEPSIQGQLVSGEYFSLLGVPARIGRVIGPDDDRVPNGHPLAMLSYGYWERRFARDPTVVGRTIRLSGVPFTVIGVTPPEFFGVEVGTAADVFLPLVMQPTVMPAFENLLEGPIVNRAWVQVIARTKPGTTTEQAAAVMDGVLQAQAGLNPQGGRGPAPPQPRLVLTPTAAVSSLHQQFSKPLSILLAMVGVVLLTACANTASLLFARVVRRRPEFAMRLALGAARVSVVRQLMVESILLAALGGICGLAVAYGATRLLVVYISSGRSPIALDPSSNPRILLFTMAVSIVTGLLFGLLPAWRGTRDLSPALKNVRSSITRGLRPGRILAVAQLALSLLLIAAAAVFVRSLNNLYGADADVRRQSVVILRVEPRGSDQRGVPGTTERLDRTYRELIRRTQDLPGVRTASMANVTPTAPTSNAGVPATLKSGETVRIPLVTVYPGYFTTIGMPLARGRDFDDGDLGESAAAVCIVNESFLRQVLPNEDPIGKPCHTGRRARLQNLPTPAAAEPFTIVGVVKDSRYSNPRGEIQPVIYMTFLQTNTGRGQMVLHARATGDAGEVIQRIREQVAALDPSMPMFDVHTLEEEMGAALVQQRLIALLSSLFGALALMLACVGLYGLLAFALAQRTNEMGIRIALGADRRNLVWMIVREAWVLVGIGVAAGIPAAVVVARLASDQLSGLLFRQTATDPVTLGAACAVLALVATVAAYLPARRASHVDPMVALRAE